MFFFASRTQPDVKLSYETNESIEPICELLNYFGIVYSAKMVDSELEMPTMELCDKGEDGWIVLQGTMTILRFLGRWTRTYPNKNPSHAALIDMALDDFEQFKSRPTDEVLQSLNDEFENGFHYLQGMDKLSIADVCWVTHLRHKKYLENYEYLKEYVVAVCDELQTDQSKITWSDFVQEASG